MKERHEFNSNNQLSDREKGYQPTFRGPMDGIVTSTLRTLDTNEMANAVLLDLGAMVTPRTYIDTKKEIKMQVQKHFLEK